MKYLRGLNDMQRQAVMTTEGPLLVLAGAGSGKTTVLVNRLAYILAEKKVSPYRVLAITFTNKAANEMKQRTKNKVGEIADNMWISTFHSMCVRILRTCIDMIGYSSSFVIYDTQDQKTLIKECMKDLGIDEKAIDPKSVIGEISNAKDNLQTPEIYEGLASGDYRLRRIAKVYSLYQSRLKKNNALDFDDLIFKTIEVFSEYPDVLEKFQDKFQYIMVDEYQDTNNAQFMLVSMLSQKHRNLCVVGDDDQSIYKFRGANIENILGFETVFSDAKVIKLEQNYRSTQNILDAANAVIANNKGRKGKKLWTENKSGTKISSYIAETDHAEAEHIIKCIRKSKDEGRNYSDFAVLYRMNAQSRVIEEKLIREGMPYKVLAGLRFYDRKEIKDMIAYLRVLYNPADDVSLARIINEPKRGIGNTTLDKAHVIAEENNTSLFDIISHADSYPALARAEKKLLEFSKLLEELMETSKSMKISDLLDRIMSDTGYMAVLEALREVEGTSRIENLKELKSVVAEYESDEGNDPTLAGFLERVSLVSDIDKFDPDEDAVILMTIHSAKGLEFPVVFLPGLEEGLFPGQRVMEAEDIEEERRLCYVAITRAKEELYISRAERRMMFGKTMYQPASRFVKEIPSEYLIEEKSKSSGVNIISNLGFYSTPKKVVAPPVMSETEMFNAGDRIRHKKFGEGTVISSEQFGRDFKLEVVFDTGEKKILMAAFAKLEKI